MLPCCFPWVSGGVVHGVPAQFDVNPLACLRTLEDKSVLGIWNRKMSSRAIYDPLAMGRSMRVLF